ncbi:uncharacterized protein LOC124200303 [Daphnia pulex]|uniref:uncharacterized protein LOC124200303 n=1 Tax=Daphnia pulex TaxID=6669 RepID=UPI001EDD81DA|nr:uncharacterized protein LOC124200303 [Daphnia pulex]
MHFTRIAVFLFFVFSMVDVLTAAAMERSAFASAIDTITAGWGSGRTANDGCIWKGTSPFCDGGCAVVGHVVRQTSTIGDGVTCLTGLKVLCCPSVSPMAANVTV